MQGIDYAWGVPPVSTFTKLGYKFVLRYISHDASKDLDAEELISLWENNLGVGVVFESTANRPLGGHAAGQADAQFAVQRVNALGLHDIPIFFAGDFDIPDYAPQLSNTPKNALLKLGPVAGYWQAVGETLPAGRRGAYGGYWLIKRLFDAGLIDYGWQTYAWSGGQWDPRAQLRQVHNGVRIGGLSTDVDESVAADFGVRYPKADASQLRAMRGYWSWVQWRLGEQNWRGWRPAAPAARPNVPARVPFSWWVNLVAFVAARKVRR